MDLTIVNFDITSRCNLSCKHCGSPAVTDEKYARKEMSTQTICRLLEEIAEVRCKDIVLGGGEPFVRKDIFEILEKTFSLGINVGILTNGILLNREKVKKLGKFPNLKYVRVSMEYVEKEKFDEHRGTKNGIQIIERNLNLLKKEKIPIGISATIFPQNVDQIKGMFAFSVQNQVNFVRIVPLVRVGRGKNYSINFSHYVNILREILSSLREHEWALGSSPSVRVPFSLEKIGKLFAIRCLGGVTSCTVSPNGVVKFCAMLKDPEEKESDAKIMGFRSAWESLKRDRAKLDRKLLENMGGRCSKCEEKTKCQGGCFIEKVVQEGDLSGEQPFCLQKAVTEAIGDRISDSQTRKILAGIIARQEMLQRAGVLICVRSLPLWIHPLSF